MKNFKLAELNAETRYTVVITDKENNTTERKTLTGEELSAFVNGAAHLYDFYLETLSEDTETETKRTTEQITAEIINYFEENEDVFVECIEELDNYNGYLCDDRYYNMDELDEYYSGTKPSELLARAFYGHDAEVYHTDAHGERIYGAFNPNREYFRYNGYGNLVSCDYKDYSDKLDEYFIDALVDNRYNIDAIDNYEELESLFEELEQVEEDNEQ
jgi:hypothetical protein